MCDVVEPYRIRAFSKPEDADHLFAMIQELALFEKSPESVSQTAADFRRDGLETEPPLFYAAIAERNDAGTWRPVGYATWNFTYSSWKGRGMYLDDCKCRSS